MKIKTSEATPLQIDWAVATCAGNPVAKHSTGQLYLIDTPWADKTRIKWLAEYSPTKHWAQGGPIIEREGVSVIRCAYGWVANIDGLIPQYGTTPLIAAMRCYVASKLGDEVTIPEELK